MKTKIIALIFIALGSLSSNVWAQQSQTSLRNAEVISAKSVLEDMLIRRYSQELSAFVSHENFSIGSRIELTKRDPKLKRGRDLASEDDNYTDLDLGYLDADALFEAYSTFSGPKYQNPLEKYSVKSVDFKVGLWPTMGENVKKTVNEWLQERVKQEFGSVGTAQVQYIQNEKTVKAKKEQAQKANPSFFERLKEMQDFAGSLVLAIAIILGVMLWRLLSGGSSSKKETDSSSSINIENKTESGSAGQESLAPQGHSENTENNAIYVEKTEHLSNQIKELTPKITRQIDGLIQEWCEKGEEGLLQLACFAELTGSTLGSLPIPKEFKGKMGGVFSKMHDLSDEKCYSVMNKTYWDIVASLNLGTQSLHQPFSFLGNATAGTVSDVLLENNADMQTVVSLYMPDSMRKSYFSKLDENRKLEVLKTAASLSVISQNDLQKMEDDILPYFEKETKEDEVSMDSTMSKLIETMNYVDSCRLLPKIEGPVIESYKRTQAHIGFVGQWNQESLSVLAKRASNEEITALLRILPQMQETMLGAVSPLARKVIEDDLETADISPDSEKEKYLQTLHNKLVYLVNQGEISLEDALPKKVTDQNKDGNVAA